MMNTWLKRQKSLRVPIGVVLAFALLICPLAARDFASAQDDTTSATQMADPIVRTIVAGLKNREGSILSATGNLVTLVFKNKSDGVLKFAAGDKLALRLQKQETSLSQLYFAVEGQKAREDNRTVLPKSAAYYELISYDGERLQRWRYGTSGAAEKTNGIVPGEEPSQAVSILQLPIGKDAQNYFLSDSLLKKNAHFVAKERLNEIDTYKLTAQITGGEESWWIAPDKDFVVIKHETISTSALPNVSRFRYLDIVDHLVENNDIWIPSSVRNLSYVTPKGELASELWTSLFQTQIGSVQINKDIARETFNLPLPMGTRIAQNGQFSYTIGGDISQFEERATQPPTPEMTKDISILSSELKSK